MFCEHRAFTLPKDLHRDGQNQDAYRVRVEERLGSAVAAIADGVSASLFARSWAQCLVSGIVDDPPYVHDEEEFAEWLTVRRAEWLEPIDESALAWHQKAKFRQGAQATLLWIDISVADRQEAGVRGAKQLFVHAIGDSCLLHVRESSLVKSFPVTGSGDFDNDPRVLCSFALADETIPPLASLESYCQPGDFLILCTDAVAAWALWRAEQGEPVKWKRYWAMDEAAWQSEIVELRQSQQMRQDDATLVMLKIGED